MVLRIDEATQGRELNKFNARLIVLRGQVMPKALKNEIPRAGARLSLECPALHKGQMQAIRRRGTACVFLFLASSAVCAKPSEVRAEPADPALVEKGEYLARAADCTSCHTVSGGKPFAGGLRINTPFGFMLTPNITPDEETGIGAWTADDFYRALHEGVNKKGQDLYPVMPYTFYTKVTRADLDAIFAYLREQPAVRNDVDVNHLNFPFDIRLTQLFWRELYFREGTFVPGSDKSEQWNRAPILLRGLGIAAPVIRPATFWAGSRRASNSPARRSIIGSPSI